VTCGDWDLTNCLAREAKAKNIELPEYLKNYINIKNIYRQCLPEFNESMGMMGMLKGLNIPHEGRHHSGIDDVLNICNICIALMKVKGHKYTKQQIKYVK
jgi:ERI1 exoribonuclease 3